jgi:predicted ATP-grasp superfamily ATP-dependent carboligase
VLNETDDCVQAARELGYPVVVKPVRGAGCEGVRLARDEGDLREAVAETRCELRRQAAAAREDRGPVVWRRVPELQDLARSQKTGSLLLQQYVRGVAASVSLLCDGRDAVAVAVNAQVVQIADDDAGVAATRVSYLGGQTPLDHPLAPQAAEAAVRACRAVAGLRGFVGVDVVVTDGGPIVIEINPRLTTAYLGVRRAVRENVAALALAACAGTLPAPPTIRRAVRFTSDGRVSFVSTSRHVAALCQARFETARPGDAPTGRLNRR